MGYHTNNTELAPISSSHEMLQAQAHVFHHVMGHMGSMSLKCAVQLGIPDVIHSHGHPMTISDLLSKLPTISPTKAPSLQRIMRILTQMGYFKLTRKPDNDAQVVELAYSLTPLSTILLKDSPTSLRTWLLGILSPHMTATWHLLSPWLESEQQGCTHEFEHGQSMWDLANENPEFNLLLNEFMAGDTRLLMNDWTDEECVVILKKCKEAIPGKGGKVMIIDIVLNDSQSSGKETIELETQLFWDLAMLISTNGKEREKSEWEKIFVEAGFSRYKFTRIGLRSLIQLFP